MYLHIFTTRVYANTGGNHFLHEYVHTCIHLHKDGVDVYRYVHIHVKVLAYTSLATIVGNDEQDGAGTAVTVFTYICMDIHTYICVHIYMYMYIHTVFIYMCMYIHTYIGLLSRSSYIYVWGYTCIHTYVYMYTCIQCMHIYKFEIHMHSMYTHVCIYVMYTHVCV